MGLVQREIEAAGFSTIALSMIPELTASAGAPRIAAIEHPFGVALGRPFDEPGQMEVLRAALRALAAVEEPGRIVHLPFEWTTTEKSNFGPPVAPPIVAGLLAKAAELEVRKATGAAIGYAAPEVAGGAPPTPVSDLYSAGVLLFAVLATLQANVKATTGLFEARLRDIDDVYRRAYELIRAPAVRSVR